MAPSSRTASAPSVSHPFPPSRTRPAPASVITATVTATSIGSQRDSRAMAGMTPASTTLLRRNTSKAAALVSSSATRKRTRRDTLDENEGNDARKSRVRQRLSSRSSIETIRADPSELVPRVEKASRTNISRSPSSSSMSPTEGDSTGPTRPLAQSNHSSENPGEVQKQRTLRRVGTIVFSNKSGRTSPLQEALEVRDVSSTKYTSRIPLPLSRSSSMSLRSLSEVHRVGLTTSRQELRPRACSPSANHPRRDSVLADGSSRGQAYDYVDPQLGCTEGKAPSGTAIRERFNVKMRPIKKHVEVWDLPEESIYAWGGILVLTDLEGGSGFPIESINVDCSTHAYEGRFSLETNSLPVYSTSFIGSTLRRKELGALTRDFDPKLGIVLEKNWTRNPDMPNQWYVKFWVPVPMDLFRTRDTRMFRLEAQVNVVDNRTHMRVSAGSGTVLGGISHLKKQKDMDRRVTL